MNHIELHKQLSDTLVKLTKSEIKHSHAKEIFNGAGKIIANAMVELTAIKLGIDVDVPLLDVKQIEAAKFRRELNRVTTSKLKKFN